MPNAQLKSDRASRDARDNAIAMNNLLIKEYIQHENRGRNTNKKAGTNN
ncbi:hypothetical protein NIES4075_57170 [Tolypothrix sp. NIES-4075]|nr:hypothetical protein NIES4075_57170 [Tolypothrix sp. NIES-4075]